MTSKTPRPVPARPIDALSLRSPDALVSALPHLLGFTPSESAVVVWLRHRRILLTQRIDLPSTDADHGPWLEALVAHRAALEAEELVLVVATEGPAPERIVRLVIEWATVHGIAVRDALRWNGSRWWSLLCADPECCTETGREVSPSVAAAVAAEFALLGSAPLPDRAGVARTLALDADRVDGVIAELATSEGRARRPGRANRERWRDMTIDRILDLIRTTRATDLTPPEAGTIIQGLVDVRVRDTVLWECAHMDSEPLLGALRVLSDAVRCAPHGVTAPVATTCAVVAWMVGDGTRAMIATERAREDDPGYSLATLIDASLRAGLPPQAWREATAGLSRAECRHGSGTKSERQAS